MFPIHCNSCNRKREAQNPFQLNRCYHIICSRCKPSGNNKCPVCKQQTKGIAITSDLPSNVANYFQNPDAHLKMFRTICKFQCEQRALRYKHYFEQQKLIAIKQEKLQGYIKLEAQLRQQIDTEKKRIRKLRDYAAYYEQDDEAQNTSSSFDITITPGHKRRMCRPRTPSISVSDISVNDINAELSDSCLNEFNQFVNETNTSS